MLYPPLLCLAEIAEVGLGTLKTEKRLNLIIHIHGLPLISISWRIWASSLRQQLSLPPRNLAPLISHLFWGFGSFNSPVLDKAGRVEGPQNLPKEDMWGLQKIYFIKSKHSGIGACCLPKCTIQCVGFVMTFFMRGQDNKIIIIKNLKMSENNKIGVLKGFDGLVLQRDELKPSRFPFLS